MLALDQAERSLASVRPPADMRNVHRHLLGALTQCTTLTQLHHDAYRVMTAPTPAARHMRATRLLSDERGMRRDFAGLGLSACL